MNETYYLFSNGDLKRKDDVIRLTTPDKKFKDIKVETTKDIYLFGKISLNTKRLNYLGQPEISLHIFNYYGFSTGSFHPKESNISGRLLVNQVKFYEDSDKRIHLAKKFIEGASHNIKRNLSYYERRGKEVGEIFKPLIADKMIFSLSNKNIITEKDFSQGSNFYYLGDKGKKKILMEFDQRMNKTIKHKDLGRDIGYRHLIKLECYKLIKHLMNDKEYEPFKIWW